MRPRGERQFARRHVRHDLVVRGASDPFIAGQATDSPTCAEPTSGANASPSYFSAQMTQF